MSNSHLTPHDKFFRSMMFDTAIAREFFEQNLPEKIKAKVDLTTVQLRKESFINDKLRVQITDLLYSADFSGQQGLYLSIS